MGGAVLASLVLHGLLGVLLLKICVQVHPKAPEFVELNLGRVTSAGLSEFVDPVAPHALTPSAPEKALGGTPKRVEIPKRRMIEIEEPAISVSEEERMARKRLTREEDEKRMPIPEKKRLYLRKQEAFPAMGEKKHFDRKMDIGIVPGSGRETTQVGADVEAAFTIEGEVKNREILSKVLPDPTEVHREAVIRIWFTVRPDGMVGATKPVRKGDTHLENLALAALKQWRFHALNPEQKQVIQTGEITFTYTLK
jgi:outer membrane biosynthesis protein TonB